MSDLPEISLRSVVFDCPDAVELARFYQGLLGGEVDVDDPDWTEVRFAALKLAFQRVEHYQAPQWPDGLPQQVHLDLTVSDPEAASVRAIELGAARVKGPVQEDGCEYIVHLDPAGHPFCLCHEFDG